MNDKNFKFLRIETGEEIISGIIKFCEKNKIESAWFSGLGAAKKAEVCIYDLDNKKYINKDFNGPLEIGNVTGNIATKDGKIVIHCHITFSDITLSAWTGHLNSAIVGATFELFFIENNQKLQRKYNEKIGLNLLDI